MKRAIPAIFMLLCLHASASASAMEKIAGDFSFTEGVVQNQEGEIFFTDAPNNRIHKINLKGGVETYREDSGSANGLALDPDGSLIVCEQARGRVTRLTSLGIEVLADTYNGKPFNSPNDVVIASNGAIYFSDPRWNAQAPHRPAVYQIKDGVVTKLYDKAVTPNGVQLSSDEKTLFIGDTAGNNIIAYDLNAGTSFVFAGITSPDGMAMDAKGNLYVAQFGVGQIQVFNKEGKSTRSFPVPEKAASNCSLSADETVLLITAGHSVYKTRLD